MGRSKSIPIQKNQRRQQEEEQQQRLNDDNFSSVHHHNDAIHHKPILGRISFGGNSFCIGTETTDDDICYDSDNRQVAVLGNDISFASSSSFDHRRTTTDATVPIKRPPSSSSLPNKKRQQQHPSQKVAPEILPTLLSSYPSSTVSQDSLSANRRNKQGTKTKKTTSMSTNNKRRVQFEDTTTPSTTIATSSISSATTITIIPPTEVRIIIMAPPHGQRMDDPFTIAMDTHENGTDDSMNSQVVLKFTTTVVTDDLAQPPPPSFAIEYNSSCCYHSRNDNSSSETMNDVDVNDDTVWILSEYCLPSNSTTIVNVQQQQQQQQLLDTTIVDTTIIISLEEETNTATGNQNESNTDVMHLPIRTKQGAMDIWTSLLQQQQQQQQHSSTIARSATIMKHRNRRRFVAGLGRSIESGVLRMELIVQYCHHQQQQQVRSVQIQLSQRAMKNLCHKSTTTTDDRTGKKSSAGSFFLATNRKRGFGMSSGRQPSSLLRNETYGNHSQPHRKKQQHHRSSTKKKQPPKGGSKTQQQQEDLYMALVLLFPDSDIADLLLPFVFVDHDDDDTQHHQGSSMMSSMITAQQVYALTDNVQLHQSYNHDNNENIHLLSSIPGLLPTLRPYQSKAVEWMLQREQQNGHHQPSENNNNTNDEWELAWIVLSSQHTTTTINNNGTNQNNVTTTNRKPEFLPSWKQKHYINDGNDDTTTDRSSSVLLFCPFTGWMTNSIRQAREWTMVLGSSSSSSVISSAATTGCGILAESMGLGKTVEVLACILSNPRCCIIDDDNNKSTSEPVRNGGDDTKKIASIHEVVEGPVAKRQLDFKVMSSSKEGTETDAEMMGNEYSATNGRSIGCVVDENDFGDADNDSEDDESRSSVQLAPAVQNTTYTDTPFHSNQIVTMSTGVLVTPTKVPQVNLIEERWTDNDILGACICGNLIGFDTRNGRDSIILCCSCNEPMHTECAAFDSIDTMIAKTVPLRYRHTFTNATLDCRICQQEQCPCCVANVSSGATLIVTPPAILNQWEREIIRHTRHVVSNMPLRVVIYDGIKRLTQSNSIQKGSPTIKYMHPRHLAEADIVLITFDALMNDLGHADDNQFVSRGTEQDFSGVLRKRKRYRVVPSPLLSIKWWRVCLDEAQRVETPTAGSARMALKLDAVHRWCISGTPIHRGSLNDLYGLLLFLRLDPFLDRSWFQKCFNPTSRNINARIKHLLHNVFWRSTKASELVRTQMGIPEQIEKKIMLKFSSIEKHFYDRQLEQTILATGNVNNNKPKFPSKKKSSRLHLLTDQLHKLRAACCHPQVGSSGITAVKRQRQKDGDTSVSSRVMTMSQILDKFIDDAKVQCEESQRLTVLHTNGMAATSRLKVEAKSRGVRIRESDCELLETCCQLYNQSLRLSDENGTPTLVWGEVILTGSSGFRTPGKAVENYSFCLEWQKFDSETSQNSVWAKIDVPFGSSRKLTQVRARTCHTIPISLLDDSSADFKWCAIYPKDCTFQCLTTTGEYANVHSFSMPSPDSNNEWILANGFRTNKSKSWRLVVDTFYTSHISDSEKLQEYNSFGTFVGIEFQCYEATIASDPLQRLHCLHNASQAYSSLLQLERNVSQNDNSRDSFDTENASEKVHTMMKEANKIESLYLDSGRSFHKDCQRRLEESAVVRLKLESELHALNRSANVRTKMKDCWDDFWWDDFLVLCHLYGTEVQQTTICDKIRQDLDGVMQERVETTNQDVIPFPLFGDLTGLRTALQMRIRDVRSGLGSKSSRRNQQPIHFGSSDGDSGIPSTRRFRCLSNGHQLCMQSILVLTETPSEDEIHENSRCHVCKADWLQTGPKCRHCKIGDILEELAPDKATLQLLYSLHSIVRGNVGSSLLKSFGSDTLIGNRAKNFFEVLDACKKERSIAYRLWRTHLNLLNDIDELNQCKSTMRLREQNEDVTELSKEQLNAVIEPFDVNSSFHHYAAKQAMALGALSRAKGTLHYLKNLSARERDSVPNSLDGGNNGQTCLICLSKFDTDRAILRCGHSFHLSPCLERLRNRSGGNVISCPLRCTTRTMFDEVLIASEGKRHDDGSHSGRNIRGSYGTKVTRLISDVLDICDLGEKGVVFSQWEDMLDICEHALNENGVQVTRVASLRQIGKCTRRFREPDCSIMLLNVKNGAEGLTLVEATHVFMVEPLLNCGLDIQAINRIHRIGQQRKTYVWRYIVNDTVEARIDTLRMKNQEDQFEDSIGDGRRSMIQAGGIDGGFQSQEELLQILQS